MYTQVRLFDGKNPAAAKNAAASSSVWYDDGSASDAVVPAPVAVTTATQATSTGQAATTVQAAAAVQATTTSVQATTAATDQSPVRPPRRRCGRSAAFAASGPAKRSQSLTAGTTPAVKSILKKPASLTTDDLSPVRSRATAFSPAVASALAASNVPTPNHDGSQKKTKKQVQFDIVTTAVRTEKPDSDSCPADDIRTATDTDSAEQRPRHRQQQSPSTGMRSSGRVHDYVGPTYWATPVFETAIGVFKISLPRVHVFFSHTTSPGPMRYIVNSIPSSNRNRATGERA